MDAKITKSRLGLLLSYDWIKILAVCAAGILLWILLFTTLATRATGGQTFELYTYMGIRADFDALDDLDTLRARGAFSQDVLDFTTSSLTSDYGDTILQAHTAAGQGDVMFVADTADETDEDGNVTGYTGLKRFLSSYFSLSFWLGEDNYELSEGYTVRSYFASCEEYLGRFFKTDGKADAVVSALNAYRDDLVNNSMQYPMNIPKVNASKVYQKGDYVFFIMLGAFAPDDLMADDSAAVTFHEEQNQIAIDAIDKTLAG